ncbi:hypothetical protein FKW77_006419 [Venturia effusa]|uniref:Uncharacterized protein n=1 Tax=Venturia effusa TaxID=50376 RepID=A0A517LIX4_9PEZI|nr:hypothetical protein FKW77_006419 [Venturia effusa]
MRIRRSRSPLLLLLLPSLATSLTIDSKAKPGSVAQLADGEAGSATLPSRPGSVGTKDAPVDGLDGKPHAGPFVEPKKLPPAKVEDLGPKWSLSDEVRRIAKQRKLDDGFEVPKAEDSVMDDRAGEKPNKGPKGTEGGVSEKDRLRQQAGEGKGKSSGLKKPEQPKAVPASVEEKAPKGKTKDKSGKEADVEEKPKQKGAAGLEKPLDLPDKPHDIPHPSPKGSHKSEGTEPPTKYPSSHGTLDIENGNGNVAAVIQPFHSYILAMSMILVSEIGDKTFLVAALMAMRHPRILVFSAASAALIIMTVLSAVLGHAVPTLIPERLTHFAAAILFLVFGAKLGKEGLEMSPDEGVGEEMKEVEMELEEKESHMARRSSRRSSQISPYVLEAGQAPKSSRGRRSRSDSRLPAPPRSPSSSPSSRSLSPNRTSLSAVLDGISNLFSLLLSPVWVQTFVMTFLAEWGDRSQIATIAMAAGQDYWWVTGGAISGHAVCTFVAVMGGRAIAGRISTRKVTLGGAIAFLVFGVLYFAEAVAHP